MSETTIPGRLQPLKTITAYIQPKEMIKITSIQSRSARIRRLCVIATAIATALATLEASAADPVTHPLSRDHVNLVRVQGQKITDVVYDTNALAITTDKARGIVFVRVNPSWLESAATDTTSAFFNTETDNIGVRFLVSAVPSQTVELVPETRVGENTMANEARLALAAPLAPLQEGDFVSGLKKLVTKSFSGELKPEVAGLGTLTQAENEKSFAVMPPPDGFVVWRGFKVRETQAFVTTDKLTETLVFTRITPKAALPDAAALAKALPGVLAVAQEVKSGSMLQTEITVIRSRESAAAGTDFYESALTLLAGDAPAHGQTKRP